MSFISWIKQRGKDVPATVPRPEIVSNLFAEWREDYKLAKLRDQTGREPEARPTPQGAKAKIVARKPLPKRERLKGHDIPF
jgi:hypothetical protein